MSRSNTLILELRNFILFKVTANAYNTISWNHTAVFVNRSTKRWHRNDYYRSAVYFGDSRVCGEYESSCIKIASSSKIFKNQFDTALTMVL